MGGESRIDRLSCCDQVLRVRSGSLYLVRLRKLAHDFVDRCMSLVCFLPHSGVDRIQFFGCLIGGRTGRQEVLELGGQLDQLLDRFVPEVFDLSDGVFPVRRRFGRNCQREQQKEKGQDRPPAEQPALFSSF